MGYKGDVRLLFPTLYLSAADLRGRDASLTIRDLTIDSLQVDGGSERKAVIYFEETAAKAREKGTKEKRLVLNKTNMKAIGKALGTFEARAWVGRRITLYPTTTEAFGDTVDCIRVRKTAPPPKGAAPDLEASDEHEEGSGEEYAGILDENGEPIGF